jgi:hypothetical protein
MYRSAVQGKPIHGPPQKGDGYKLPGYIGYQGIPGVGQGDAMAHRGGH